MSDISLAIKQLVSGGCIIIRDDQHRENEGDLVCAAYNCSAENINFMAVHGRGMICMPLSFDKVNQLELTLQPKRGSGLFQTAFTTSIDAAVGVTTGISAHERALTIRTAAKQDCLPEELATPGHVFPLRANKNGLLARKGHTEASLAIMQLAKLPDSAVVCEILNIDGSMARHDDLLLLADKFKLPFVSIEAIESAFRASLLLEK